MAEDSEEEGMSEEDAGTCEGDFRTPPWTKDLPTPKPRLLCPSVLPSLFSQIFSLRFPMTISESRYGITSLTLKRPCRICGKKGRKVSDLPFASRIVVV